MTLAEMRGRMSSREFAAWIAYDRIQPIGSRRDDLHFAYLMALVDSALSGKPVQIAKHDPFAETNAQAADVPAVSCEDSKRQVAALTRRLGGLVTGAPDGYDR